MATFVGTCAVGALVLAAGACATLPPPRNPAPPDHTGSTFLYGGGIVVRTEEGSLEGLTAHAGGGFRGGIGRIIDVGAELYGDLLGFAVMNAAVSLDARIQLIPAGPVRVALNPSLGFGFSLWEYFRGSDGPIVGVAKLAAAVEVNVHRKKELWLIAAAEAGKGRFIPGQTFLQDDRPDSTRSIYGGFAGVGTPGKGMFGIEVLVSPDEDSYVILPFVSVEMALGRAGRARR